MTGSERQEPKTGSQCRGWWFALLVILLIAAPIVTWVYRETPFVGLLLLSVHLMLGAALGSCTILGALLGPLLVGCFLGIMPGVGSDATRLVVQVVVGVFLGFTGGLLLDRGGNRESAENACDAHRNKADYAAPHVHRGA